MVAMTFNIPSAPAQQTPAQRQGARAGTASSAATQQRAAQAVQAGAAQAQASINAAAEASAAADRARRAALAAAASGARDIIDMAIVKGFARPGPTQGGPSPAQLLENARSNVQSALQLVWWTDRRGSRRYAGPGDLNLAADVYVLQRMLGMIVPQPGAIDATLMNRLYAHRAAGTKLGNWVRSNFFTAANSLTQLMNRDGVPRADLVAAGWNGQDHGTGIRNPSQADIANAIRWQQEFDRLPFVATNYRDPAPGVATAEAARANFASALRYGWWTDSRGRERYASPEDPKVVEGVRDFQFLTGRSSTGHADRDTLVAMRAFRIANANAPLGQFLEQNFYLMGGAQAREAWARGTGRPASAYQDRIPNPSNSQLDAAIRAQRAIAARPTPAQVQQAALRVAARTLGRLFDARRRAGLRSAPVGGSEALNAVRSAILGDLYSGPAVLLLLPRDRDRLMNAVVPPYVAQRVTEFNAQRAQARHDAAVATANAVASVPINVVTADSIAARKAEEARRKIATAQRVANTTGMSTVVIEQAAQEAAQAARGVTSAGAVDQAVGSAAAGLAARGGANVTGFNIPGLDAGAANDVAAAEAAAAAEGVSPTPGVSPAETAAAVAENASGGAGAAGGLIALLLGGAFLMSRN